MKTGLFRAAHPKAETGSHFQQADGQAAAPCASLHGQVACEVFHDAKPALKAYTLRKRKETFDWINELTRALFQVSAVRTQP